MFFLKFKPKLINIYVLRFSLFLVQYLCYHPRKFSRKNINRILIIRLKHMGDLLLSLPTVNSLKINFPKARIILVTGIWNKELAEGFQQLFDRIFYYNVNGYCRSRNQIMNLKQKFQVLRTLRKMHPDLCIDFDGSLGFLYFYLSRKIKYLASIESLRFLQNLNDIHVVKSKFSYSIHKKHEMLNLAEIHSLLQIQNHIDQFNIEINDSTVRYLNNHLKKNNITTQKPIIGIHPAASDKAKMWSLTNFAKLADYLTNKFNANILLFGSKNDQKIITAIQRSMKSNSLNCTHFTVMEFIASVKHCNLFICLDSFAQHVAFLQGVPLLVLYMQENPIRWAPYGDKHKYSIITDDQIERCHGSINSNRIELSAVINNIPKSLNFQSDNL